MDGRTDGRMYGRTDGISPHSTGLRPLLGPLPKKEMDDADDNGYRYYDDESFLLFAFISAKI